MHTFIRSYTACKHALALLLVWFYVCIYSARINVWCVCVPFLQFHIKVLQCQTIAATFVSYLTHFYFTASAIIIIDWFYFCDNVNKKHEQQQQKNGLQRKFFTTIIIYFYVCYLKPSLSPSLVHRWNKNA